MHSPKVRCGVGTFGIVGPYLFKNDNKQTVTIDIVCYVTILEGYVEQKLRQLGVDPNKLHFPQDRATAHTARRSMAVVCQMFGTVISRYGAMLGQLGRMTSVYQPFSYGATQKTVYSRGVSWVFKNPSKPFVKNLHLLMKIYGGVCTITSRTFFNNALRYKWKPIV